jgi:hypothetical protein
METPNFFFGILAISPSRAIADVAFAVGILGTAVGILGTIVSLLALVLVFYVERVRRPKLTIERAQTQSDMRGFDYLHVAVRNLPYQGFCGTGLWRGVFTRQVAVGCTVTVSLPETPNGPEPWTAMWSHAGQPEIFEKPVQSMIPSASRWDVQPSDQSHLLPVVIHWHDRAETYAHDGWNFCAGSRRLDRRIPPGRWKLTVVAASGEARAEATLYLSVPSAPDMKAVLEDADS